MIIDFRTKIRNAIVKLMPSNFTIIWAKQNGVEPKKPYITLDVINVNDVGQSESRYTDTAGEVANRLDLEFIVAVNYYGTNASFSLKQMLRGMDAQLFLQWLDGENMAIPMLEQVQDISFTSDDNLWNTAANCDVTFRFADVAIEDVGYMETIELGGVLVKDLSIIKPKLDCNLEININIEE